MLAPPSAVRRITRFLARLSTGYRTPIKNSLKSPDGSRALLRRHTRQVLKLLLNCGQPLRGRMGERLPVSLAALYRKQKL